MMTRMMMFGADEDDDVDDVDDVDVDDDVDDDEEGEEEEEGGRTLCTKNLTTPT